MSLGAQMRRRVASAAALAAIAILVACTRGPAVSIVGPDGRSRARVRVEIADSDQKRETGLMYRTHLDEGTGMLFVFRAPDRLRFWMKNTEIPLDMIFADGSGRVAGIVANAEPYSAKQLGVDAESQYVLEVNGGFCGRHGIVAGDRLQFDGFTPNAGE